MSRTPQPSVDTTGVVVGDDFRLARLRFGGVDVPGRLWACAESRGIRHANAYPEVSPRVEGSDADAVEDDRRAQMGEPPVCRGLRPQSVCWHLLPNRSRTRMLRQPYAWVLALKLWEAIDSGDILHPDGRIFFGFQTFSQSALP